MVCSTPALGSKVGTVDEVGILDVVLACCIVISLAEQLGIGHDILATVDKIDTPDVCVQLLHERSAAPGILESMSTTKKQKSSGRIGQLVQVFKMTTRADPSSLWWILLALVLPILIGVALALFVFGGHWLAIVGWVLLGVLTGVLGALIVLGRKAESVAYSQIEGQPGAVGAVLRSSLKRSWQGSELPVAVNPKTQDAVYRVIGRPGVVLIAEGSPARVQRLLNEERIKVQRVVPNITVTRLVVGDGTEKTIKLKAINRSLAKLKPALTRAEVTAVANRLNSLDSGYGVPKGMDPNRVRPDHKAIRGR